MRTDFVTRVIQVLAGAPQGGAELHFVRLAVAFERAGLDQRIVMRPHPALLQPLRDAGVYVAPAPFHKFIARRLASRLADTTRVLREVLE